MKTKPIELKLIRIVLSPFLKTMSAQRWVGNILEKINGKEKELE